VQRPREIIRCAIIVGLLGSSQSLFRAATLAGHQVQSGTTLDFQFPLSDYFQRHAAEGSNPRPTAGRALLMFPNSFDPARSWPILIVTGGHEGDGAQVQRALHWFREIGKF